MLLTCACALAQAHRSDLVREHVTDAGARIWSFPDDGGDRFVLMVLVGAGSRHEDPDKTGVAHLLEHVLLASTQKRRKAQANRQLDVRGGVPNGYTKQDVTTYYLSCPSESWEYAVEWLAEHLVSPAFDPIDVKVERGIVFQELDARQSHLGSLTLEKKLYPRHPLSRDIGGDKSGIEDLTEADLRAFYDAHYRAPNVAIGFAGRVPHDECVDAIRDAFAGLRAGGDVAEIGTVRPWTGIHVLPRGSAEKSGWMHAGYHLPPGGAADKAVQLVLRHYLAERMFDEVRERRQLSYAPSVGIKHYADTTRLHLDVQVSERSSLQTVMEIFEQVVANSPRPDLESLDSAVRTARGVLEVNSVGQLGPAMELAWLVRRAGESPSDLQNAVALVSARDLGRYARNHLTRANQFAIATGRVRPGIASPWALLITLLVIFIGVDLARGRVWMKAIAARFARQKAKRARKRAGAPIIKPVAFEDVSDDIEKFFEEEDRRSGAP